MYNAFLAAVTDSTFIVLMSLTVILLLVSLFLIMTGLRGRKIDGHPLCRTCGHDLYGSTNAVRNCPKCGRALRYRKDVRVGNRRKQKGRIVTGGGGVFLAGLLCVFAVVPSARSLDWLPQMPKLSMPKFTMSSKLQTPADWKQAYDQLASTSISKSQANRVANLALILQEDQDREWIKEAGLFVEKVHEQGKLDDKLWMRYVNNVIDEQVKAIQVPVRPVIDHGARPYYQIHNHPPERSGELRLDFIGGSKPSRVEVNGGRIYTLHPPELEDWSTLPTGKVSLRFLLNERYCFEHHFDETARKWISKTGEFFERDHEVVKEITILPEGQSTVTAVKNEYFKAAVQESVKIFKVGFEPALGRLIVYFNIDKVPIALALDASIKIHDKWYPLKHAVTVKKGHSINTGPRNYFDHMINTDIQTVDIKLTPSAEAARRSLDITEYWDGELLYENVPVSLELKK